jgi:hypothetical protein
MICMTNFRSDALKSTFNVQGNECIYVCICCKDRHTCRTSIRSQQKDVDYITVINCKTYLISNTYV